MRGEFCEFGELFSVDQGRDSTHVHLVSLWSLGPAAENVPNFSGCTRLVTHVLAWDVVAVSIQTCFAASKKVETRFFARLHFLAAF